MKEKVFHRWKALASLSFLAGVCSCYFGLSGKDSAEMAITFFVIVAGLSWPYMFGTFENRK